MSGWMRTNAAKIGDIPVMLVVAPSCVSTLHTALSRIITNLSLSPFAGHVNTRCYAREHALAHVAVRLAMATI